MDGFEVEGYEEQGTPMKLYDVFKRRIDWKIDEVSKMIEGGCKASPEFIVDPCSTWHFDVTYDFSTLSLFLTRDCDTHNAVVYLKTKISNSLGKVLDDYYLTDYVCDRKVGKAFVTSIILDSGDNDNPKLDNLPDDQLVFTVYLEMHCPAASNLRILPMPIDMAQCLPPTMQNIIEEPRSIKTEESDIAEVRATNIATICPRSFFLGHLMQKVTSYEEDDGCRESSSKKLETFMLSEFLKTADFDTVLALYRATCKFSRTDIKEECKQFLMSMITPDNIEKILDSMAECRDSVLESESK